VASAYVSEEAASREVEELITVFAKADAEKRLVLIEDMRTLIACFKNEVDIQARWGKTSFEVLLDVLDNPSKYTSEELAIAENAIEKYIADQEARLQTELVHGETDYTRLVSNWLRFLKERKRSR
jgi:hypothetical protein